MPRDDRWDPDWLHQARTAGARELVDALALAARNEEDRSKRLAYKFELLAALSEIPHTTEEWRSELFSTHILAITLGEYERLLPYAREYFRVDTEGERPGVATTRLFLCAIALGSAGDFAHALEALTGVLSLPEASAQFPFWYIQRLVQSALQGDSQPFRRWGSEGVPMELGP